MIEKGYCQCGCGEKTTLATQTNKKKNWIKGEPNRFVFHHQSRSGRKMSRRIANGYVLILKPEHPRANCWGYVREHILVAERALGKFLPDKTEIHHVNQVKSNNTPSNLVICPDRSYHVLLHQRTKAIKACGKSTWRPCKYCKQYDDPNAMALFQEHRQYTVFFHAVCKNAYSRAAYAARKEKPARASKQATELPSCCGIMATRCGMESSN